MLIHPLLTDIEKPARMNNPFNYEPHPLCIMAAEEVKRWIEADPTLKEDADRGKMFGVLVVENSGGCSFLAAYSGLLAGRNDWPQFVPPVFDAQQPDGHFKQTERKISEINQILQSASDKNQEDLADPSLVTQRKQMSEELQLWLFRQYRMLNGRGETKDLVEIWQDYHTRPKVRRKFPTTQ